MKNINKGFTLIELLVVIGIIAVLTGLITFNFNSARARARDVQRKNDMKAVQQALEIYRQDHGQLYPPTDTWDGFMATLKGNNVISTSFTDPKWALKANSWTQYTYVSNSPYLTFTLTACLENRADSDGVPGNAGLCFNSQGRYYQLSNP